MRLVSHAACGALLAAFCAGCERAPTASPKAQATNHVARPGVELRENAEADTGPTPLPPTTVVTVFSSFGPGHTFDTSVGWAVQASSQGYRGQAEWWIPTVSGDLSTLELAIQRRKGAGRLNLFIAQDRGGRPGTILETFTNVLCRPEPGQAGRSLVLSSKVRPGLRKGVKYWVCAEPADDTTECSWMYNNQGLARGFAYERSQWSWSLASSSARNGAFCVGLATPLLESEREGR